MVDEAKVGRKQGNAFPFSSVTVRGPAAVGEALKRYIYIYLYPDSQLEADYPGKEKLFLWSESSCIVSTAHKLLFCRHRTQTYASPVNILRCS